MPKPTAPSRRPSSATSTTPESCIILRCTAGGARFLTREIFSDALFTFKNAHVDVQPCVRPVREAIDYFFVHPVLDVKSVRPLQPPDTFKVVQFGHLFPELDDHFLHLFYIHDDPLYFC
jgi:hypothetical protein